MRFVLVGAGVYSVNVAVFAGLLQLIVQYPLDLTVSYFLSNALMYPVPPRPSRTSRSHPAHTC
jgi:hypothetical protein